MVKFWAGAICAISALLFVFSACILNSGTYGAPVDKFVSAQTSESIADDDGSNAESKKIYKQNDSYKLFYGTWRYTRVVSQHLRLGGDEGYEDLIGKRVTYLPDYYECNGEIIYIPTYFMSVYPLKTGHNQFFPEQIGIERLLPSAEIFVHVDIVNRPLSKGGKGYIGTEFIVKDNDTLFCFDYNSIYEMTRESYMDGYNPHEEVMTRERG